MRLTRRPVAATLTTSSPVRSASASGDDVWRRLVVAVRVGYAPEIALLGLTGLDAAGARAVATSPVKDGRLVATGQRRGTRYVHPARDHRR